MGTVERMNEIYLQMKEEIELYQDYVSIRLKQLTQILKMNMDKLDRFEKKTLYENLKKLISKEQTMVSIYIYSFLIKLESDKETYLECIDYVRNNRHLSVTSRFYIYSQLARKTFLTPELQCAEITKSCSDYWCEVVHGFKDSLGLQLEEIPKKERNKDLIVMIASQILGELHAPTKVALEKCRSCIKTLGKEVILINTAEVLSLRGEVPYFEGCSGNYVQKLSEVKELEYKDVKITYIQCQNNMPDIGTMKSILNCIHEMKPYLVIGIGPNVMFDMGAELTTSLFIPLTANIFPTRASYQICYKENTMEEECKCSNVELSSIINSRLEFNLEQNGVLTKEELGLPENKFILTIFGARLDDEITEEYCEMLEHSMNENMFMTFVGKFKEYEHLVSKYPRLKRQSKSYSVTDNMLGFLENCDLYVNARRCGGGTSAVAAIYKGVPVVTLGDGDIAANVGKDFVTDSYKTMSDLIQRYEKDTEFYEKQSERAKMLGKSIVNTDNEFARIVRKIEEREYGEKDDCI